MEEMEKDLKTVHDLLKVAFILRCDGRSHGEPLRKALLRQLESQKLTPEQHAWYCNLGAKPMAIDDEVSIERAHDETDRALKLIEASLPGLEWAVLVAKYSPFVPGAEAKLVLPRAKVDAISALAIAAVDSKLAPSKWLACTICARQWADVPGLSIRSLADTFGISKSEMGRFSKGICRWLAELEANATGAADYYLRQTGFLIA